MKFSSDYQSLAHHFMYNNDYSECYGCRMFSENNLLYSYGHHYIMAKKLDNNIILINDTSYSVTTSKQMRCLENAISSNWTKFYVSSFTDMSVNIKEWFSQIQHFAEKLKRAKSRRGEYEDEISILIDTIKRFKEVMKVKYRFNKDERAILDGAQPDDVLELAKSATKRRIAIKRAKQLRDNKKAVLKAAQDLENWKQGANIRINFRYGDTALLRLSESGQFVETSQGSSVKVDSAKVLFKMIKAGREIVGYHIDSFTVLSINGVLEIGCHKIEMEEVRRFADLMHW